jgi:hypothetical protein
MSNFETIKILENSRKIIEIDGILLDVKNVSNFFNPDILIEIETYNIGNFYISNTHPKYMGHSFYNNCDLDSFKSKLNKITHYLRNKNDLILSLTNNIDLKIDSNEVTEYFKKLEDLKLQHKTKIDEIQEQLDKILEERKRDKEYIKYIDKQRREYPIGNFDYETYINFEEGIEILTKKYKKLYDTKTNFNQFLIENTISIRNKPITTFYKGTKQC